MLYSNNVPKLQTYATNKQLIYIDSYHHLHDLSYLPNCIPEETFQKKVCILISDVCRLIWIDLIN